MVFKLCAIQTQQTNSTQICVIKIQILCKLSTQSHTLKTTNNSLCICISHLAASGSTNPPSSSRVYLLQTSSISHTRISRADARCGHHAPSAKRTVSRFSISRSKRHNFRDAITTYVYTNTQNAQTDTLRCRAASIKVGTIRESQRVPSSAKHRQMAANDI